MTSSFVSGLMKRVMALPREEPLQRDIIAALRCEHGEPKRFHVPPPGNLSGYFPQYQQLCRKALYYEWRYRNPRVAKIWEFELHVRHSCQPYGAEPPLGAPWVDGCLGCKVEQDKAQGKRVVKFQALIEIDTYPPKMGDVPVKPKLHKRSRHQSEAYHKRVQKKWNKKVEGKTEIGILPETQYWILNRMQVAMLQEMVERNEFGDHSQFPSLTRRSR